MSDTVDKAEAWDAATAVPRKAQAEIKALKAILRQVISIPVNPDLERMQDRCPTFYGDTWEQILNDPVSFVETNHIKTEL